MPAIFDAILLAFFSTPQHMRLLVAQNIDSGSSPVQFRYHQG